MNREAFLEEIARRLKGLPEEDVERSLDYFREMIDDRMEDGMSEEEAVADLGTPEAAAMGLLGEMPLPKLVRARMRPKRALRIWEIVLLVLGSPVWLPLVLTGAFLVLLFYLLLALFVLIFLVLVLSVGVSALAAVVSGVCMLFTGNLVQTGLTLGAGLALAGVTLALLPLWALAARGDLALWRRTGRGIRRLFIQGNRRERNEAV